MVGCLWGGWVGREEGGKNLGLGVGGGVGGKKGDDLIQCNVSQYLSTERTIEQCASKLDVIGSIQRREHASIKYASIGCDPSVRLLFFFRCVMR